ncbi:hypothetical protein [Legionella israelensis]|uniref:Uncharacterized protein n=1 Tax=Legionella israelensis TaxID=454 RepID=A0A0W0V6Z5_9GAMM|nr:hypothetical protein [Legionella israelensis]KTD15877.1 hypothetical protein Lisr_2264 [Legionella israelensis]QBS10711.1 hypothetical protein E4T55_13195 [Legionella israelensis]SCY41679.1 hypothetical protein SAMN02746069_02370 [Legionella israelensis DSM 19235]STX57673.1 Uncharacterised protein [Legionella israelensis]
MNEIDIKLADENGEIVDYGFDLISHLIDQQSVKNINNEKEALYYYLNEDEFISYDGIKLKFHLKNKTLLKNILINLFTIVPAYISSKGTLNFTLSDGKLESLSIEELVSLQTENINEKVNQLVH